MTPNNFELGGSYSIDGGKTYISGEFPGNEQATERPIKLDGLYSYINPEKGTVVILHSEIIKKHLNCHDELVENLEMSNRWFDKLINDADFTPLAINDPLKPLLQQAKDKIEQALSKAQSSPEDNIEQLRRQVG